MDKFGVKSGMSVCVVGIREEGFLDAVRSIASGVKTGLAPKSEMIIAGIESRDDLEIVSKANLAPKSLNAYVLDKLKPGKEHPSA